MSQAEALTCEPETLCKGQDNASSMVPINVCRRPVSALFPQSAVKLRKKSGSQREKKRGLTFWWQWSSAFSVLTVTLCLLTWLKTGEIAAHYRVLAVLAVLMSVPVYSLLRVYYKQQGYLVGLARLLGAWLVLLASLTILGFITKTSELFSREVVLVWAVLGFALQASLYLALHYLLRQQQAKQRAARPALIIGTGALAIDLAYKLSRDSSKSLVGLVATDEYPELAPDCFPTLGNVAALSKLIGEHRIERLYIALPLSEADQIEGLYINLLDASVDVIWVPDLKSLRLLNHSVTDIEGLPAIHLNESPLTAFPAAAASKELFDRLIALLAIIGLSPVLLVTALLIKKSSPGPVIYKQQRHGWNGKVIKVWKFRSMYLHADKQVKQATREDPRITPIGRFIRRTSIDELPQLFNVLQGDMALVGPRPHAVAHNDYYTGKIDAYMARHRIKPGITGLAQISGCRGETETIDKMENRVELDLAYINNWSLWLDLKILIKTPFTLLGKDIY